MSGVAVGSSEVAIATPRWSDERGCVEPTDGYDAIGCHPGGELVQIAEVIDGDTLALVDGREIQLIGIDAPELDDCAGSAAADAARAKVGRQPAELHREAGLDRDKSGHLLAYINFSDPFYYFDLAYELTQDGLAKPFAGYAGNPAYMQSLKEAHDLAKTSHAGQFGPPCGTRTLRVAVAAALATGTSTFQTCPTAP